MNVKTQLVHECMTNVATTTASTVKHQSSPMDCFATKYFGTGSLFNNTMELSFIDLLMKAPRETIGGVTIAASSKDFEA